MSDYCYPEKRTSKKDLKRKRLFRAYKRGGKFRSANVSEGNSENPEEKK